MYDINYCDRPLSGMSYFGLSTLDIINMHIGIVSSFQGAFNFIQNFQQGNARVTDGAYMIIVQTSGASTCHLIISPQRDHVRSNCGKVIISSDIAFFLLVASARFRFRLQKPRGRINYENKHMAGKKERSERVFIPAEFNR